MAVFIFVLGGAISALGNCRVDLDLVARWSEADSQIWVFQGVMENEDSLAFQRGPHLRQMQEDAVATLPFVDPVRLIRRQKEVFRQAGRSTDTFDLILSHSNQWIGPVSCWEASMFEFFGAQIEMPIFAAYREFGAYLLKKPQGSLVRLYVQMNHADAILPVSAQIEQRIHSDLGEGFQLESHLHNHPFRADWRRGDWGGTTVPSGEKGRFGDFSAYERMVSLFQLKEARITNGIHTLRVSAKSLLSAGGRR